MRGRNWCKMGINDGMKEIHTDKLKCFTSSGLKLIALCTMTIDHIGAVLLPQYLFLRIIGRIAFPIYCFLIVNGMFYTKDCKKYIGRLMLFALISEVFFDLAFFGTVFAPQHQNVFFTLAIGLIMIYVSEQFREKGKCKILLLNCVMELVIVALCCLLAFFLQTDYSYFGIIMIYGFYIFRYNSVLSCIFQMYMNVIILGGVQSFAVLALPIIGLYNGKPGKKKYKWLFYVYYPAHLLVLFVLEKIL